MRPQLESKIVVMDYWKIIYFILHVLEISNVEVLDFWGELGCMPLAGIRRFNMMLLFSSSNVILEY